MQRYSISSLYSEPLTRQLIYSTTSRVNTPDPCTRQKNRVKKNEAHLLDKRLQFESAGSLTLVSRVIPPADEVI